MKKKLAAKLFIPLNVNVNFFSGCKVLQWNLRLPLRDREGSDFVNSN